MTSHPKHWLAVTFGACALVAVAVFPDLSRVEASPPGPSPEAQETRDWWNERNCRLVSLEGAWSAETSEGFARLRPDAEDCAVALLSVHSGQVSHYPVSEEGEVVFAHGWIMVNPHDQATLPLPVQVGDSSATCTEGRASRILNRRFIERIVWHEGGHWQHEVAPDLAGHQFSLVAGEAEDGSQATFEVFFSLSGAAMTFADDDGGLCVSQFEDEDGYSALCICLP